MSRVAIHVWHTPEGQIVAIGRPGKSLSVAVTPVGERGHTVLATDVDEVTVKKLHEIHVVDTQQGVLVRRDTKTPG